MKPPRRTSSDILSRVIALSIVAFFLATMLFGCKNDLEKVKSLDFADTLPDLSAIDVKILYSELGHVQIELTSPLLVQKMEDKEKIMEFPNGFILRFFDSTLTVKSQISADYGISYENKKLMEARNNVVVENFENHEKLNTEQLFWDRNKEKIYSYIPVKITRGNEVIYADTLISDQTFEHIYLGRIKGEIEVKDDDKPQQK